MVPGLLGAISYQLFSRWEPRTELIDSASTSSVDSPRHWTARHARSLISPALFRDFPVKK
jgi:hypothetical protein